MKNCLLGFGTDGTIKTVGPFDSRNDALAYSAENTADNIRWVAVDLIEPSVATQQQRPEAHVA